MTDFTPFYDDSSELVIGDNDAITIENGTKAVSIYGEIEIRRDQTGLERARRIKAAIDAIVAVLQAEQLPASITITTKATHRINNPFRKS